MRHPRSIALIGLVVVACAAMPAVAHAEADLAVTQSAHQDATVWPVGPAHTGPIKISPDPETVSSEVTDDYVTFLAVIRNHGPDAADVTFTWNSTGINNHDVFNYWTAPVHTAHHAWQGGVDDCDTDRLRCQVRLASGETYEVIIAIRGNAPGSFSLYSKVNTASDPNPANNTSEVFAEPVVCSVNGTTGDDVLSGTSDFDSICGRAGNDRITAVGEGDRVFGGAGDDVFGGQPLSQGFIGGMGSDTVTYASAPRAIRISLADKGARGWGWDMFVGVENVVGSRYGDYIEGSGAKNTLVGGRGTDRLYGRSNADVLVGGRGADDFISQDESRDVVDGGPAADGAYRDSRDVLKSAYSVSTAGFANLDIAPPIAEGE